MSGAAEMSVRTAPLNGYGMPYRVAEEPDEITLVLRVLNAARTAQPGKECSMQIALVGVGPVLPETGKEVPPPGSGEQV
jgi:hypothetical protein